MALSKSGRVFIWGPSSVGDIFLPVLVDELGEKHSNEDEKQVQAFLGNVQILIDRKAVEQDKLELESQLLCPRTSEAQGGIPYLNVPGEANKGFSLPAVSRH